MVQANVSFSKPTYLVTQKLTFTLNFIFVKKIQVYLIVKDGMGKSVMRE